MRRVARLPLLYDRWHVATAGPAPLTLAGLLDVVSPATELLLDLKGTDVRLGVAVADQLARRGSAVRSAVCARNWALLAPLAGASLTRIVHSAGTPRELAALLDGCAGRRLEGVSARGTLLNPRMLARVRERTDFVLAWTVNSTAEARDLVAWGVDALISDDLSLLERAGPLPTTFSALEAAA